jgi:transketolase
MESAKTVKLESQPDGFGRAMAKLGGEFENLIFLAGDVIRSVRGQEFKSKYPDRFFDVGISEANMVSMAAGLSTTGLLPVISSFAVFAAEKPFEQIRNSICYPGLNVKIAATHGGINVGMDGVTHQAIEDIAIMRAIPNMVVIVPADSVEVEFAMRAALKHKGPVYIRMGREKTAVLYEEDYGFEIGKAHVLKHGEDVSIVANGMMVAKALEAADILRVKGIDAEIVNMHTVKPLDEDYIIKAAQEKGCIVAAEEHNKIGGLGSAIAETIVKNKPVPMEQVAIQDIFAESGQPQELFEKYGLTANKIVQATERIIERK